MKVIGFSAGVVGRDSNVDRMVEAIMERTGGAYAIWGDEARTLDIAPELFRCWEDRPETVARIEAAAEKLRGL